MSYDRKGKGKAPQKRRISPEVGESSRKRQAPGPYEDQYMTQVTESFGNLGILATSHSQAQGYRPPPATASNYQSTGTEATAVIFAPIDDSTIISTVAAGWSYDEMKNRQFQYRDELTPWLLERRAQELGAVWTEAEDSRLLKLNLGQREEYERLASVRDRHFSDPRREAWDIQARNNRLRGWSMSEGADSRAQAGESSQAQQYSAFYDQPGGPAYHVDRATYSRADQPPLQPVAVTQGLAYLNTSSAPTYEDAQAAHQPIFSIEPGDPGQGSSNAGRESGAEDVRTLAQLWVYVPEIKERFA